MAASLVHQHKSITPPAGVEVWDVDPYDEDILMDPVPFFTALRDKGGLVYIPRYEILACGRYDETREVFYDHKRFVSSRGVGMADFKLEEPWRPPSIVLEVDPPEHTHNRRVILRALSPAVVRQLEQDFADDAENLIDSVLAQGAIEAVTAIAEAFPTRVFPRAVGIKQPDSRKLVDYGAMVFNAVGPDNPLRQRIMAKAPDIVPWINEQCDRSRLTENGIGATIYAAADTGEIGEAEAGMLIRSLLSAGVDTTVSAIGSALWCLAKNPAQFALLKTDPEKLSVQAFEEALRFCTPVQAFFRTAGLDTTVGDVAIEEGSKILCVLGAANRDPRKFENPEDFDITRDTRGHLALGVGVHSCVGQIIARAEGRAILRALAQKVSAIEFAGDPVWRPNNSMRALDSLPLKLR
ncbi:MAG: cytochrome P450 [Alphaproteobacteria bacterium]